MTPDVQTVLNNVAGKLLFEIVPQLPLGYGQGSAATMALLLIMAAQDNARAAELNQAENMGLQAIFAKAERIEALKGLVAKHADAPVQTLIDLHARLEEMHTPDARALRLEILDYLALSAERRLIVLPAF